MKKNFIYKDEKSHKFWTIETDKTGFTVTYGKAGTAGQSQTKTFDSENKCLKEAEKLISEKLKKGYQETEVVPVQEKPVTTKVKSPIDASKLEKQFGVTFPDRLKIFYNSGEYQQYEGRYVHGLKHYTKDSKFKVKFTGKQLFDVFDENDIEMPTDEGAYFVPLSPLGEESQFLAVDISKGNLCPVAMWEHEDGMFYLHSDTLDEFLKGLLEKGEKTPFEKLDKTLDNAQKLYEKKKYKEALTLLNTTTQEIGLNIPEDYEGKDKMGRFFNLRGMCYEGTETFAEAIKDYHRAMECGDYYSALNIIDYYIDKSKEYAPALKLIEVLEEKYLDAYCRYHVMNYKGLANIYLGNQKEAEEAYQYILKNYAVKDPGNIEKSIKDLQEVIKNKITYAAIATHILTWFGLKSYEMSDKEREENRHWWNSLDKYGTFWKKKLKAAIKLAKQEPGDDDIARMFEAENLSFEKDELIQDLTPFLKFKNLTDVRFYGDVDNLDVFKEMKTLKRLTYNGDVNKNFKVPSKLNIQLIEAAASGNFNQVKENLKKGADVNAKAEFGKTALIESVLNRHYDIACYLIQQGAYLYATDQHDSMALDFCSPEDKQKLEAEFKKAGGIKKECNFLLLQETHQAKVCRLGYLENVENVYELKKGILQDGKFPENALFPMRKDYPGYKKDTKLVDCFIIDHLLVVNKKARTFFETKNLKNVEIFPVKIRNHEGEFIPEEYYIINPLAVDCLDVDKSEPTYNHINPDIIKSVNALVIDESKLDPAIQFFRIKNHFYDLVLRKELAEELQKQAFSGITFKEPRM